MSKTFTITACVTESTYRDIEIKQEISDELYAEMVEDGAERICQRVEHLRS